MRILHINTSSGWGGMEMHPLDVAEELARRGNIVLFAMKHGSPMQAHARGRRFAPICLPFRWYLDPASFPVLQRIADAFRIQVVHIHSSRDVWRSLVLGGVFRRRAVLVLTRHMGSPAGNRKDDLLHRVMVQRVDTMIAISQYICDNIRQTYAIPSQKVKVVRYGLGETVIGDRGRAGAIREEFGVPQGGFLVGMVAQITPDKRQDLFLRAARLVLDVFPACRFVLAGAPVQADYAGKIREEISELRLEGKAWLTGYRGDIRDLMKALDVLVLPSKAEAFGLVLLEAMANGRPIVGSASGAVPEIVRHERNGLLFEPGVPKALAEAVIRLLRSEDERERMGEEGKRMFLSEYTLEKEVERTEALYRSLVESAGM